MASASRLARVLGRLPLACPPGELLLFIEKAAPAAAQALLHDVNNGAERLRLQASGNRLAFTEPCPTSSAVQQHGFASSALAAVDRSEQQQLQQQQAQEQQGQQSTSSSGDDVAHAAAQQHIPASAEPPAAEWIQQEYQQQQPAGITDTSWEPAVSSSNSSSSSSSSEEQVFHSSGDQAAPNDLYNNNSSSSATQTAEHLGGSSSSSNEVNIISSSMEIDVSSSGNSNEVYGSIDKVHSSSGSTSSTSKIDCSSSSSDEKVADRAQGFLTAQGKQRMKVQLDKSINMCPTVKALVAVIDNSPIVPAHSAALALQRLRRLHLEHITRHHRQIHNLQQQLQSRDPNLDLIKQQQQRLEQQQQQHEADVEQLTQKLCDQLAKASSQLTSEQIVQSMSALGTLCSPLPNRFHPLLAQLLDQLKGSVPTLRTNYLPLLASALASLNASNLDSQHSLKPTDHNHINPSSSSSSSSSTSESPAAAAAAIDASDLADHNRSDSSSSNSSDTTTTTETPAAAAAAAIVASDPANHLQPPASTAPAAATATADPAAGAEAADLAVAPAEAHAVLPSSDTAAAAAEAARQLLVELCEFIQRSSSVASLDAGGVAKLISAFGRLGHYDWQAMRRLSLISIALAQSMTSSNITSVLMGCAKLRHYDQELCAVLADSAESRMSAATGPQVSQIAWALAHMKHDIPGVFAAAAQQATQRAHELEPRHLSNISWAFAVRKAYSPTLCNTTAARVQQLLDLSNTCKAAGLDLAVQPLEPHHLSLIAWSFAKQGHKLEGFMQDLGEAAAAVVNQMLPQNISNLAWAYGRLSVANPKLFDALTAAAKGSNLEGFGNQNMTDLAWGCAATKYQDDELFDLLSRSTVNIMHELSPHSLSDLIWAFAVNKASSATAVLTAAAPAAAACLERFSAGMLADLMYSYAYTKVYDENMLQACAQVLPLRTISLEQDTEAQAKVLWCLKTFNFRDPKLEATLEEIIPSIKQLLDS